MLSKKGQKTQKPRFDLSYKKTKKKEEEKPKIKSVACIY